MSGKLTLSLGATDRLWSVLNESLFRRRLKMLVMLARGYSLNVVVETLSKENNCQPEAIYHDRANMHVWAHVVEQDKASNNILRTHLDHTNSETSGLMKENNWVEQLNIKDKSLKIGAMKADLKVIVEQIRLAQELVSVKRKNTEINENLSVVTPFEADPMLRKALLESIVEQKTEKVERDAAKGSDASRH